MSACRTVVVFLALATSAGLARADGLFYNLPKDGTWATYELTGALTYAGQSLDVKGTLRIASVGQVTERKQPCRWIEVDFDREVTVGDEKQKTSENFKVLIPEKYLVKGQTPLDHVLRAWRQVQGGQAHRYNVVRDVENSPLPILLSGPWKDLKQLPAAAVESKLGNVPCEGVEGTVELKRTPPINCPVENRLHANSPFGVVAARWTVPDPVTPMKLSLKLTDFGEDATSKMPNAK